MEQESARSALVTVSLALALALAGCQKTEKIPAPKTPGSLQASEPATMPQTPPLVEPVPAGSAPGEGTPPSQ